MSTNAPPLRNDSRATIFSRFRWEPNNRRRAISTSSDMVRPWLNVATMLFIWQANILSDMPNGHEDFHWQRVDYLRSWKMLLSECRANQWFPLGLCAARFLMSASATKTVRSFNALIMLLVIDCRPIRTLTTVVR